MAKQAKDVSRRPYLGDDEELWDLMSPQEKKEQREIGKKAAKEALQNSHLWNTAVSEISKAKTRKEAKAIYKKYANKSLKSFGYVYNPPDPGDNYYVPK